MSISKKIIVVALLSLLGEPLVSAADQTTANVPVDSVYYQYLDKLSGMGYVKSLPNGEKPYSRMQLARWVLEAKEAAKERPMAPYLADQMAALEVYVAPEVEALSGGKLADDVRLRGVSVEMAYHHGDAFSYAYQPKTLSGSWSPFSQNHNGHKYGRNGGAAVSAEVSGNVASELAVSIRGRAAWDKDNDGTVSLDEAYVKTRLGSVALEAGREALLWGEGASGHLLLGNNMKPLTSVQAHLTNPVKLGGFFHFLGEVDLHSFYAFSDRDRGSDAAKRGVKDFDDAGLIGLRLDVTPSSHFTFGASRVSMLGGKGNGLSASDWGNWLTGKNADTDDKWNDIGGFDFRLRYGDFQVYGEAMGEDQAGGLPSKWAYRMGLYLPKISSDGSWDLTLEAAKTTDAWYTHWTYQQGWTYSGDIMGDDMGNDARKYYARVNHYLSGERSMGLYYLRTERERNRRVSPTVNEIGITGRQRLSGNRYLTGTLGYAQVKEKETNRHLFAAAMMEWKW